MNHYEVKLPNDELISGLAGKDVVQLAKSGRLTADSMIRQQGQERWRLVSSVPQIAEHIAAAEPKAPLPAVEVEQPDAPPSPVIQSKRSRGALHLAIAGAVLVAVAALGSAAWFLRSSAVVPEWAVLVEAAPDPSIVTSASLRSAIAATGYAWRVRDTATQIEFVLIPPGTYQRGCSPSQQEGCISTESPTHQVTLTQPFYLGRYEVTQAQWQARMGSNPSSFQSASAQVPEDQVATRPVERVSWNMIQGFLSATGMRLPTEAEWEWAYRAGTTTAFHSMPGYPNGTNDDSLVGNISWFADNSSDRTRPVGGKASNGFGLHDMSGNVREWVNDLNGTYPNAPQVDPVGPVSATRRVIRGGSWNDGTSYVRSSDRDDNSPEYASYKLGFRVARNP